MSRTTDMSLQIYGLSLIPVDCKLANPGGIVKTVKNSTLIFYGGAVKPIDLSKISYQII